MRLRMIQKRMRNMKYQTGEYILNRVINIKCSV